jgi:hypothetical protein
VNWPEYVLPPGLSVAATAVAVAISYSCLQ